MIRTKIPLIPSRSRWNHQICSHFHTRSPYLFKHKLEFVPEKKTTDKKYVVQREDNTMVSLTPTAVSNLRRAKGSPTELSKSEALASITQGNLEKEVAPWSRVSKLGTRDVVRGRPQLIDLDIARQIVLQWGLHKLKDGVVLNPYAGFGALARAALALPNIKKVIAIEHSIRYIPYLNSIKNEIDDPSRIQVIRGDPYTWEVYTDLTNEGLLDGIDRHPFSKPEPHPSLSLITHIPHNTYGEQLGVQMITAANPDVPMWLYQTFGRFEMGILGDEAFFDKLIAKPGEARYHKLSVLTKTLADIQKLNAPEVMGLTKETKIQVPEEETDDLDIVVEGEDLEVIPEVAEVPEIPGFPEVPETVEVPVKKKRGVRFPKPQGLEGVALNKFNSRFLGGPKYRVCGIKVVPYQEINVSMESLEYVTRTMFVTKSINWTDALSDLAIGAGNLLPKLLEEGMPKKKKVSDLTEKEWHNIARAFDAWPFKPQNLFDLHEFDD